MSTEMKTEKDILIEVHNTFLDRKVREDFDERLCGEAPEEEKKAEKRMEDARKELENMEMIQKVNSANVPIAKVEGKRAEVIMLTKQFRNLRVPRLLKLVDTMMKEVEGGN